VLTQQSTSTALQKLRGHEAKLYEAEATTVVRPRPRPVITRPRPRPVFWASRPRLGRGLYIPVYL